MPAILITVDALRADHLGQYGYRRDTMPALDRLTAEGTRFDAAFANGPYTRISVPSFQTSRLLAYDRVDELPTLGAVLSAEGLRTAVIGTQTGMGLVDGDFGYDESIDLGRDKYHREANRSRPLRERLRQWYDRPATKLGPLLRRTLPDRVYAAVDRGYRAFDEAYRERVPESDFQNLGYESAARVTDAATDWLADHADEDFFLWLHYMEGHRPYGVHDDSPAYLDAPLDRDRIPGLMRRAGLQPDTVTDEEHRQLVDAYDSDLRYCSRHLERLFDALESEGLWAETDVVFTSDHGEEFREHGEYFHRNYPYDELIHVPLLVRRPGVETPDGVADQRELLDLAPTLCDWLGVDAPDSFEGEPLLEGEPREVIVLGSGRRDDDRVVAGRWDGWKYIHDDGDEQLYDLSADPGEREDRADEEAERCATFRRAIPDYLFDREGESLRDPVDEVDRAQLEALGYLELREEAAGEGAGDAGAADGPDREPAGDPGRRDP